MASSALQSLCELGQEQLMEMNYLAAEASLVIAEREAFETRDFDTLARLYMPLQEARRQRRQRCGEGIVQLDLLSNAPDDARTADTLLSLHPQGQLLVAGWGSVRLAANLRNAAQHQRLYVETFLGAVFPIIGGQRAVVIVPLEDVLLPPPVEMPIDRLLSLLPAHCIVLHEDELPRGARPGTVETYAHVMAIWERLHTPFLAAADMQRDPIRKIELYRRAIQVDYACELAHQKLAAVAHECKLAGR